MGQAARRAVKYRGYRAFRVPFLIPAVGGQGATGLNPPPAGNDLAGHAFISYAFVPMDTAEIADLVARAQQADPAAFEELVDAYSARLYGYFYRLTGARHDAEDLLQEVFVRLVRAIGGYKHDGRFDAWLFRMAANLVRDRVRRKRAQRAAGLETGVGFSGPQALPHQPDQRALDPAEAVHHAEQVDRLQWAIGQLPETEREVILLRHFAQLSFRQIAEVMATPLGTALARGHRGLARLRGLMDDGQGSGSVGT